MRNQLKYIAVIEARMTSSRLPGKMMMDIGGKPSLQILIERLKRVKGLSAIVVATTRNPDDDPLHELCTKLKVGCFRGSETDVLGRVLKAAQSHKADVIVEITGDCTLLDPAIIEESIGAHKNSDADFVANCVEKPHYPGGMDARIFSTELLSELDHKANHPDHREHVSLYFWEHPEEYKILHVKPPSQYANVELFIALDEESDLNMMRRIYEKLVPQKPFFTLGDIIRLLREEPDIYELSQTVQRRGLHGG